MGLQCHTRPSRLDILLRSTQLCVSTQPLAVLTFIFWGGGEPLAKHPIFHPTWMGNVRGRSRQHGVPHPHHMHFALLQLLIMPWPSESQGGLGTCEESEQRVPKHPPASVTRGAGWSPEPLTADSRVHSGSGGFFPIFSDLLALSGTHTVSLSSACDCTIIPSQKTN